MPASDGEASGGSGDETKNTVRKLAPWYAGYVVVGAIWPRVVNYRAHLRGRPLALYTGYTMIAWFATLQWLRPWARRKQARTDAAEEQLAGELGREPTTNEVIERLDFSTS